MERSMISPKSLIFDLYLRPSLLVIGLYQTIVTVAFTSQQLLLAAYLDEKGYIVISGIIIAVYFVFWFIFGPIFSTLSDLHGRKLLMILANCVSFVGFFGLVIASEFPSIFIQTILIMNALLGIGAAIRVGSTIALWVQHSPQDRVGESLAYNNILGTIGGFTGAVLGFLLWTTIKEQAFILFGILLLVAAIPIVFVGDSGNYVPFSLEFLRIKRGKSNLKFFFSPQFIQVCLHWLAFSTIVAFSTFIIPILERLTEETGSELNLPFPLLFIISVALVFSCVGGLVIWGRISDLWARKPVLIIGYVGMTFLVLSAIVLFLFDWLPMLLDGLANYNPLSLIMIGLFIISIFTAVSVITTPMALISDKVGQEDLAKAMSLRQVLIGVGTVIGVFTGGFAIGLYGIPGLLVIILILFMVSAVILL